MPNARVAMYVDGFNLYYGLFRSQGARPSHEKWLNPARLGDLICQERGLDGMVGMIRYCSSESLPSLDDPDQPVRQRQLFNALESIPFLSLELGLFKERAKSAKLFGPRRGPNGQASVQPPTVLVSQREEKGSDVNLATFLVRDAALDLFDVGLVISNDSDLKNAIAIARNDFGREIWVVTPHFRNRKANIELQRVANRYFWLNTDLLVHAQFPDELTNEAGAVIAKRPREWYETATTSERHEPENE